AGLSVATVSTPLVYRSFCIPACEQLATLTPVPAPLPLVVLPHAASMAPSAATAAVIRIRRIVISPAPTWAHTAPDDDYGALAYPVTWHRRDLGCLRGSAGLAVCSIRWRTSRRTPAPSAWTN